ncbi:MAG: glycosyltransferase family 4 protein [Desulfurococcaceae archaeon]
MQLAKLIYKCYRSSKRANLSIAFLTHNYFNDSVIEGHRILSKRFIDAILTKDVNSLIFSLETIQNITRNFLLDREITAGFQDWFIYTIKIFEKLNEHNVDFVHILSYNKFFPTLLNKLRLLQKKDYKIIAHLYYHPKGFENTWYKPTKLLLRMKLFDAILTTSISLKKYIIEEMGLAKKPVFYVPPVVPKEYFDFDYHLSRTIMPKYKEKFGLNEKHFVISYIGHITPQRGIFELLKAFSRASNFNDNLRLIISHTNIVFRDLSLDYLSILNRMIKRYGLEHKVLIIAKQNPIILYNSSDVLFFGFDDSFYFTYPPLVICEAMAAGMPFILKHSSLINELFEGKNNILVYHDINELVEILLNLADKDSLYNFSAEIKNRAIRMFSLETFISRIFTVYSRLQGKF